MSNNPLKQYFRTPAIYFKLPSEGKHYEPGVVNIPPNGELAVYPMTSADEIAVRTPDALFNGASVVSVIKNCVPDILDPWKLNNIDIEAVIVAIKAASTDNDLEVNSTCPKCEEESKYGINLSRLLAEKVQIDYSKTLDVGPLSISFRPLTYAEINANNLKQFEIQRLLVTIEDMPDNDDKKKYVDDAIKRMNAITTEVVASCIASIKTPETIVTDRAFITEYLTNCDSKTSKAIRETSIELRQKNDTKPIKITCVSCKHEYEQPLILNFTDFFA